jgi:hypothetical protein
VALKPKLRHSSEFKESPCAFINTLAVGKEVHVFSYLFPQIIAIRLLDN